MRAECGCLVEDGMVMHGFDGPCMYEPAQQAGPSIEQECDSGGHAYYGDAPYGDEDSEMGAMVGRCYCGSQLYPAGGAGSPEVTG